MSAARTNPFLANARRLKVDALVDVLRAAHIDSDLAQLMDHQDWVAAAAQAKVKPPSEESRAAVIEQLRRMEANR